MPICLPSFAGTTAPASGGGGGFTNQYSVSFDGTDDYISTGLDVGGASALTVSAWVKHDSVGNAAIVTQYVGPNNRAFRLAMYPSTSSWAGLRLDAYNSSNTNFGANYLLDPVISSGVWYHAAFVFTGSAITVYYNGNASPTVSMSGVLDSVTRNVDIGSSGGSSDFMSGNIDEVAIWDSALSASDITSIYNSGVPNDISSLSPVAYYRMGDNDGGTGTTITDQGSGGNNGTLTNGPTFSTDVPEYVFNIPQQTEATILALSPTNPSGEVTVKFGSDTYDLYVWYGSAWYIYNNDYTP